MHLLQWEFYLMKLYVKDADNRNEVLLMQEYLLVDGYNIIFAWPELKKQAEENLEAARSKLADILCNYQGYKNIGVILIFDGYKSKGNEGSVFRYHNIDIVYTREAQTADNFIELVTQKLGRKVKIQVATSDGLEQMIILGKGAARMSARELKSEIKRTEVKIQQKLEEKQNKYTNSIMDNLPKDVAEMLEKLRQGDMEE